MSTNKWVDGGRYKFYRAGTERYLGLQVIVLGVSPLGRPLRAVVVTKCDAYPVGHAWDEPEFSKSEWTLVGRRGGFKAWAKEHP